MKQVVNTIEAAAGAPSAENSSGECLSSTIASQLKIFFLRANVGLDEADILSVVDDLLDVWWSLRRRRVSLFGHASHGFVQYLSYSSAKVCHGQLTGFDCKSLKQKTASYTLKATLYVLHILLNYGVELKDTLEPALGSSFVVMAGEMLLLRCIFSILFFLFLFWQRLLCDILTTILLSRK